MAHADFFIALLEVGLTSLIFGYPPTPGKSRDDDGLKGCYSRLDFAYDINLPLDADSPTDAPVVLVATQGQGDEDALESALRSPAKQVLMIASRRKTDELRALMRMRGVGASQLARLQAPAGPDAAAKTPGEIALARHLSG